MKFSILSAVIAAFMFTVGAFAEETECRAPYEPEVPDRFETYDEALASNQAVKKFVTESKVYLDCLDFKRTQIDPDAEDAAEQEAKIIDAYNSNVDTQQALANRFKAAYEKYKAEHPE